MTNTVDFKKTQVIVIQEEEEVHKKLEELGLSVNILNNATASAYLAKCNLTLNDTRMYKGLTPWNEVNKTLRNDLPKWEKYTHCGVEGIISPSGKFKVIPCSGNIYTGDANNDSSNRYSKGIAALDIIEKSIQGSLFENNYNMDKNTNIVKTYIFLYRITEKEIKAELSVPSYINKNGFIGAWAERIILPSQSTDYELIETISSPIDYVSDIIDIPFSKKIK